MKRAIYIITLLSILLSACEEEVIIDLKSIEKKLIVDAVLSDKTPSIVVKLSYNQGFYDTPNPEFLNNANVFIKDQEGYSEKLLITNNNVYFSPIFYVQHNKSYTLTIETEEQSFEVHATLPEKIAMNNIQFVPNPFYPSGDSLNAFVNVIDIPNVNNYFRLFITKSGTPFTREFFLVDDSFGKNKILTMPVYYKNFSFGDTVIAELHHLSKQTYEYYSGLSENISGSFNSIAPGNPPGNMPENVYGIFASYSATRDTFIVPELPLLP